MTLFTYYITADGERVELEGESLEELAAEVPEDLGNVELPVTDEPGFTRGYLLGHNNWTA